MSTAIYWSDRSKRRVAELGEFIAERDVKTAAKMVASLFGRVEVLADNPEIGIVFPGSPTDNVRVMYFGKYGVYYVYDREGARVTILTVRHGREAPYALERVLDDEEP